MCLRLFKYPAARSFNHHTTWRNTSFLPTSCFQPHNQNLAIRRFNSIMATLPKTMKGIVIEKTGGVEVLQYKTDLPVPTPKEGEVLVHNAYAGVNFIDTYFRTGIYKTALPYTPGQESSGEVVSVGSGETHGIKEGDKVAAFVSGTYAEYATAPAKSTAKVPEGVSLEQAAAVLLQGLTAYTLIREAHHVKKGDWVLVHAAAGGTGLLLCQLLKAVGANIIGTASTQEKIDLATKAGAQHMINYSHEDVKTKVLELTDGKGCIAVFDGVGKDTFDLSLSLVARLGSMISFGNASGVPEKFEIARLSANNVRLMRPRLHNYITTAEDFQRLSAELFGFVLDKSLDVRIHEIYPLTEVARSHQDLEGRKSTGKLIIDVSK